MSRRVSGENRRAPAPLSELIFLRSMQKKEVSHARAVGYAGHAMRNSERLSRRAIVAALAAVPLGIAQAQNKRIPIGLELFSLRDNLKKDFSGTLQAVAKMG